MRLAGRYKVVLTLIAALMGGAIAGTNLGGFAIGDAFSFYRGHEPLVPIRQVPQATGESWAYSTTSYPPPASNSMAYATADYPSEAFWAAEERSVNTSYDLPEASYHESTDTYDPYAELAALFADDEPQAGLGPPVESAVRRPIAGAEWESVGDTARIGRVPQRERSGATGTEPAAVGEEARHLVQGLGTPEPSATPAKSGRRTDPPSDPSDRATPLRNPAGGSRPTGIDSEAQEEMLRSAPNYLDGVGSTRS